MGNEFSRKYRAWRSRNLRRVLFVGLDNSGKTTALNQASALEARGTVPTTEATYSEVRYKSMTLLVTDVGGQAYLRPYWRHHFTGAQGVVYFVDSMDKERFAASRNELRVLLVDNQLKGVPVLVFANKQDGQGAASVEEVQAALLPDLDKMKGSHQVKFMSGSAVSGEGLFEALDWLSDHMKSV